MPLCRFSSSSICSNKVSVENLFLSSFMPYAPENCTKVYLLGLLYCQDSASTKNNEEHFEHLLGLDRLELIDCFRYWEEKNLVSIKSTEPLEVTYLPVEGARSVGKYNEKKYAPFVEELRGILTGRDLLPSEISHYVDFLEDYNMQGSDFCMIVKYCVSRKGADINSGYILTVARIWADEGVRTAERIEEKIESLTLLSGDVAKIAKALKYRGEVSIEHQQMLIKWTKSFGFSLGEILLLCGKVANKGGKGAFEYLDKMLTKYYEMHLFTFSEMEEYEANKQELARLARDINKALGIYYESVDSEVDTYIVPWLSRGIKEDALVQIAQFCFRSSIRTLDGMNDTVMKFLRLGLMSTASIDQYIGEIVAVDKRIKDILTSMGLDRRVNNFDRSLYRTWKDAYGFSDEIIDHAISLSQGKGMPYLSSVLDNMHHAGCKTLEDAKKCSVDTTREGVKNYTSYSGEDLDALFDNLDEIDIRGKNFDKK